MQWFRIYNEILDDPKIAKMDGDTFRCFIYLLAVASEQETEGIIDMSVEDLAWRLRISSDILQKSFEYLVSNKIIKKDKTRIIIMNWSKRQFASDDVGKRVKRHRQKQCNVTGNVTSNVIEQNRTDTDTDTDTDTEAQSYTQSAKKKKSKTSIPENFGISDRVKKWAQEKNHQNLSEHLESFILKSRAKDYQYVDWDEAFMNAIRDNWAKVGNGNGQPPAREPPTMIINCLSCGARILKSDIVDDGCVNCKYGKQEEISSV